MTHIPRAQAEYEKAISLYDNIVKGTSLTTLTKSASPLAHVHQSAGQAASIAQCEWFGGVVTVPLRVAHNALVSVLALCLHLSVFTVRFPITDHAAAAAGLAYCNAKQNFHAECVSAGQKCMSLLETAVTLAPHKPHHDVVMTVLQTLAFSLEILGRHDDAIL